MSLKGTCLWNYLCLAVWLVRLFWSKVCTGFSMDVHPCWHGVPAWPSVGSGVPGVWRAHLMLAGGSSWSGIGVWCNVGRGFQHGRSVDTGFQHGCIVGRNPPVYYNVLHECHKTETGLSFHILLVSLRTYTHLGSIPSAGVELGFGAPISVQYPQLEWSWGLAHQSQFNTLS